MGWRDQLISGRGRQEGTWSTARGGLPAEAHRAPLLPGANTPSRVEDARAQVLKVCGNSLLSLSSLVKKEANSAAENEEDGRGFRKEEKALALRRVQESTLMGDLERPPGAAPPA